MSEYHKLTPKLHMRDYGNDKRDYIFWCPGCGWPHMYSVGKRWEPKPHWEFNGDVEKPSFTPSLLMTAPNHGDPKLRCCHLFLTDGKIHYCGDCTHDLAGQVVEMNDYPWDESNCH